MTQLREGLPPLPARLLKLPLDPRGYPIPWFVGVNAEGQRDFRIADQKKRALGYKCRLCWLCGEQLGRYMAFVIGPMCVVNRNTSEPGSHLECARFAAQACPFLTLPMSQYRKPPEGGRLLEGSLPGNPGACAIYVCTQSRAYRVPDGTDWLIRLGDPMSVEWWAHGRRATRAEVAEAMQARLPFLEGIAREQGPQAVASLEHMVRIAKKYFPEERAA
jgi:hypothetical protein